MIFQSFEVGTHDPVIVSDGVRVQSAPNRAALTHNFTFACVDNYDYHITEFYYQDNIPDSIQSDLSKSKERLNALLGSLVNSKVDLEQNNFYEVIHFKDLLQESNALDNLSRFLLESEQIKGHYRTLFDAHSFAKDVRKRKLVLDGPLKEKYSPYICYVPDGTITGRYTTNSGFPILNLKKELRKHINPTNDFIIELDFNGFDLRNLLALSNKEQPDGDIHGIIQKNVFPSLTRDESKEKVFQWLYSGANNNSKLFDYFSVSYVLSEYYENGFIINPYCRKIEADEEHAVNYIIQSTGADLMTEQITKLRKLLTGHKSFVKCSIHDACYLDIASEEYSLVKKCIDEFANTQFGEIPIKVKIGPNMGDLEEL